LSSRDRLLVAVICLCSGLGCWEQVSRGWFASMKEQPAVQYQEGVRPLVPPAGTIPVTGIETRIEDFPIPAFDPRAMQMPNPIPVTPASIERGRQVYANHCIVCHGADGLSDPATVPVAKRLTEQSGGMAAPPPLLAIHGYTDGFIFNKIRYGKPSMPGYPHIAEQDRWHVVNYLRTLIKRPS
jgi:mono/diheme cytochrome c family protein